MLLEGSISWGREGTPSPTRSGPWWSYPPFQAALNLDPTPQDLGPDGAVHPPWLPSTLIPWEHLVQQSRWKPRPLWAPRRPSSELQCGWGEGSWQPPPAFRGHKPGCRPSPLTPLSTWSRTQAELRIQWDPTYVLLLLLTWELFKCSSLTNARHLLNARHCSCSLQTLSHLVILTLGLITVILPHRRDEKPEAQRSSLTCLRLGWTVNYSGQLWGITRHPRIQKETLESGCQKIWRSQ